MMRLGALTLPSAPWPELVERWRALDDLGLDSIWVADHLANPYRHGQPWFEGWSCLATMAQVTSRARIGTLVSPLTLRNPAVLVKAAVTVDHASGGRVELGVGTGGSEFDRRLARARAGSGGLRRVRELLDDESLEPRPVRGRIPLTIGGNSTRILRAAAALADRWNTYVGRALSPEEGVRISRERNAELDRVCAEQGRDPRTLVRSALIGHPFVAETPWRSDDAFLDLARRWSGAGFDELVVYYPPGTGMPSGSVADGVFERAAGGLLRGA
jgi:alkanesulfonate monooxygenase SsuD/methylene tetrahydromethanopterin reductase-like flavin-dependent oxidoreductase (luciferase family)